MTWRLCSSLKQTIVLSSVPTRLYMQKYLHGFTFEFVMFNKHCQSSWLPKTFTDLWPIVINWERNKIIIITKKTERSKCHIMGSSFHLTSNMKNMTWSQAGLKYGKLNNKSTLNYKISSWLTAIVCQKQTKIFIIQLLIEVNNTNQIQRKKNM